jgi:hypothetical protein
MHAVCAGVRGRGGRSHTRMSPPLWLGSALRQAGLDTAAMLRACVTSKPAPLQPGQRARDTEVPPEGEGWVGEWLRALGLGVWAAEEEVGGGALEQGWLSDTVGRRAD